MKWDNRPLAALSTARFISESLAVTASSNANTQSATCCFSKQCYLLDRFLGRKSTPSCPVIDFRLCFFFCQEAVVLRWLYRSHPRIASSSAWNRSIVANGPDGRDCRDFAMPMLGRTYETRSSAVAERPRDALSLNVLLSRSSRVTTGHSLEKGASLY